MASEGKPTAEKVVFLFTTFPVASETFLQREMTVFRRMGLNFQMVSLWGGNQSWNGLSIEKRGLMTALAGILWIPYYLLKKPAVFLKFLKAVYLPRSSGMLNWGENLLGAGYALKTARKWKNQQATHFHGVWASAPAMAAWFLSELTDIPFSFSGHAYDLFERGGDGWISGKIESASWIRTSTHAGRDRLVQLGAKENNVLLVRRGLADVPPPIADRNFQPPYIFLSVGRMVEKMGFDLQIPLFKELAESGMDFTVEWIGDGPERRFLEDKVQQNQLTEHIVFRGALSYAQVEKYYQQCDFFVFTGRIDRKGDRAGLPNVVAEAMAWGLPVFASNVGAVREAVVHLQTGVLCNKHPQATDVLDLLRDPALINRVRSEARAWVENEFNLAKNLRPLMQQLSSVTFTDRNG